MRTAFDQTRCNDSDFSPCYRTAVRTAVAAGLFSLIVASLLIGSYIRRTVFDAARVEELDRLKVQARLQPDNEQLRQQIRELDLQVRRSQIRRFEFSRRGNWLLVTGIGLFLFSWHWASFYRKQVPSLGPANDIRRQLRQARMTRRAIAAAAAGFACITLLLASSSRLGFTTGGAGAAGYPSAEQIYANWPRFRGPGGLGVTRLSNIPTAWDGKTGRGILWKTRVPLPGHNSPVVWENRIFLTGADQNHRQVYCFDAATGSLLWKGDVNVEATASEVEAMEDTGWAAPSAVTDGRTVCAIFANGDVACFTMQGKMLWARNLGPPENDYGHASSLAMYRSLLLIQYDQGSYDEQKSRFLALDTFSGRTVWQTPRPVPNSWTTPIVIDFNDQPQLLIRAQFIEHIVRIVV